MVKGILPHWFLGDGHRHGCSSVLTKRGYTTPLFYPQRPAFIFLSPIRSKREFPSISNKIGNFHTTKCNKVVRFRTYRPLFSLIAHRRTTRLSKITRFFAESPFFSKITPFFPFLKFPIFVQLPKHVKKGVVQSTTPLPYEIASQAPKVATACSAIRWP